MSLRHPLVAGLIAGIALPVAAGTAVNPTLRYNHGPLPDEKRIESFDLVRSQWSPHFGLLAWSGRNVEQGLAATETEIWVLPMNPVHRPDPAEPLRLSAMGGIGDSAYSAHAPAVDYSPHGGNYLVAWHGRDHELDGDEVFVRAVDWQTYQPILPSQQLSLAGAAFNPNLSATQAAIACSIDHDHCLVVWREQVAGPGSGPGPCQPSEIRGRYVRADGTPLLGHFAISQMGADQHPERCAERPRIAYDRNHDEYLVAWTGKGGESDGRWHGYLARLDSKGVNSPTQRFAIATNAIQGIDVAWDRTGGRYGLSWSDGSRLRFQAWDRTPYPAAPVRTVAEFGALEDPQFGEIELLLQQESARLSVQNDQGGFILNWIDHLYAWPQDQFTCRARIRGQWLDGLGQALFARSPVLHETGSGPNSLIPLDVRAVAMPPYRGPAQNSFWLAREDGLACLRASDDVYADAHMRGNGPRTVIIDQIDEPDRIFANGFAVPAPM